MTRTLVLVLLLTLTTCALIVGGCVSHSGDTLPQDKYVAIEERLLVNSSLISGNYPMPPHITRPLAFNYDGSENGSNWAEGSSWGNGRPDGSDYPEANGSFKVLYGTSYYRDVSPMDTRTGLRISGVYSLPHTGESGFTIERVAQNGTIYGSYNNTSIVLKPGEQWTSPVLTETRSDNGTFFETSYAYTAIYDTTWTISNLGVIDKSNLTRFGNSQSATGYNAGY